MPAYGLTETMLIVVGHRGGPTVRVDLDVDALERGQVRLPGADSPSRALVGCGPAGVGARITIVDPRTRRRCGEGEVGEIWVDGPAVMSGYWRRDEETGHVFGGRTEDGEGPFLRTGDLGFLCAGELVPCGRLKELIILHGRNLHPQDVERIAATADPSVADLRAAAFALEVDGAEQLVLVQEAPEGTDGPAATDLAHRLRTAIAAGCRVEPHAVVLVARGTVPATPTGKTMRAACRARYTAATLPVLAVAAAV